MNTLPTPLEERSLADTPALAADIARRLAAAVSEKGSALLRVSGGRSPAALFEALRQQAIDWTRLRVQLVDERMLPAGHPDRNETLLRNHLMQDEAAHLHLLPLAREQAAQRADVTVLGMGEDGHTASLFADAPGIQRALQHDAAPDIVRLMPAHAPYERISLNMAALLNSEHIVLAISGASKWATYQRARARPDADLPISLILHHAGPRLAVWPLR